MLGKSFLSICELSISASLPISVFLLAAPLLRTRFAVKWNYRIWVFLALWLVIPFHKMVPAESIDQVQAFIGHQLNSLQFKQSRPVETQSAEKPEDQISGAEKNDLQPTAALPRQLTAPIMLKSETHMRYITGLEIAAVIWLIGCICFLGMHLYGCFRYKKEILKEGNLIHGGEVFRQFQELSEELEIRQKVTLMHFENAGSPMVIGLFQPVLVLPDQSYCTQESYFILKHELVHLKRKDIFFKLLFVTVNALHWFNPLVRMMCRRAVVDIELSCDEAVVQGTAFPMRKAYTETLFSAIHKQCARKSSLSTQFYGGQQIMKKRFENILIRTKKKSGAAVFICTVVLITLLGNLTGCSLTDTFSEEGSKSIGDKRSNSLSQRDGLNTDRQDIGNGKEEQKDSEEENTENQLEEGNMDQNQLGQERRDQNQSDQEKTAQNTNTKRSGKKAYEILAYIAGFDSDDKSLDIDEIEWVTVPSRRASELDVADSYMDSGFYVYNEEEKIETLTLAQDCKCSLLNWYASYEPMEVTVEELFEILQERKELTTGTPYILTVQNKEIIKIQEHYVP